MDGCLRINEIDPVLLMCDAASGKPGFSIECPEVRLFVDRPNGVLVEHDGVQCPGSGHFDVPVQDMHARVVRVSHGCVLALGWIGSGERDIRVAGGRIWWGGAVLVDVPVAMSP